MFNILFDYKKLVMNSFAEVASGGGDNPEVKTQTQETEAKTQGTEVLTPQQREVREKLDELEKALDIKRAGKKVNWQRVSSLKAGLEWTEDDPESIPTRKMLERYEKEYEQYKWEEKKLMSLKSEIEKTIKEVGVEQSPKINNEQLSKMGYNEFLNIKDIPRWERLQYITRWNVEVKDILSRKTTELNFEFPNRGLELSVTAGQVLPDNVRKVDFGGASYTRRWISWEFFSENGARLIILNNTNLSNFDIITDEELEQININTTIEVSNQFPEYVWKPEYPLLLESKKKGYDPKFMLMAFWDKFTEKDKDYSLEIEALLTQVARYQDSFAETYNKEAIEDKSGKITEKFAWYLLNCFWLEKEKTETIAKEYWFDINKLKEVKFKSLRWGNLRFESSPEEWPMARLRDLIASVESERWSLDQQYNSLNMANWRRSYIKNKYFSNGKTMEDMTLREVMVMHREFGWAIWRYQFVPSTLAWLISNSWDSLDMKFDRKVQDRYADALIRMRINRARGNRTEAIRQLSMEWAALPKDSSWSWYWDGFNWNKANGSIYWNLNEMIWEIMKEG